jgi:hypothetical protein
VVGGIGVWAIPDWKIHLKEKTYKNEKDSTTCFHKRFYYLNLIMRTTAPATNHPMIL